jgi:hypothetical protein
MCECVREYPSAEATTFDLTPRLYHLSLNKQPRGQKDKRLQDHMRDISLAFHTDRARVPRARGDLLAPDPLAATAMATAMYTRVSDASSPPLSPPVPSSGSLREWHGDPSVGDLRSPAFAPARTQPHNLVNSDLFSMLFGD